VKPINLVEEIFSQKDHFEACILCSYTLNLNFLENYLMKLNALYPCEDICIFTDSGTYEGFVGNSYSPKKLNRRYLVNSLNAGGVFHPKLYMFASEKRAVIGIGSANLTREGITGNLELLSTFEVSEDKPEYSNLLQDCIAYTKRLALECKSTSALKMIEVFSDLCNGFISPEGQSGIRLVHNLDQPILDSLLTEYSDVEIKKVQIVSPFYDTGLKPYNALRKRFPNCSFEIYLQQHKSNFPTETFSALEHMPELHIYHGVDRYMHGKALLLHTEDSIVLVSGSANFTKSALMQTPSNGNFEIALTGEVDQKTAQDILQPNGCVATLIDDIASVRTSPIEKTERSSGSINYIIEATLQSSLLEICIDKEIPKETFTPVKILLLDCNQNQHIAMVNKSLTLQLTKQIKEKVPGKIAVQLLGRNSGGEDCKTNIAWVVELEERTGDKTRLRTRRIHNNPLELRSILMEIMEQGNEQELQRFLLQFDVPIDLILQPQNMNRKGAAGSHGNVLGSLPNHLGSSVDNTLKTAFIACIERLHQKLSCHVENPQIRSVSNYILVLSTVHSLVWFVGSDLILSRYIANKELTTDEWHNAKDIYRVLLQYLLDSWKKTWDKGGYRDAINAIMNNEELTTDGQRDTFEKYLIEEYEDTINELAKICNATLDNFNLMLKEFKVKTRGGDKVSPPVFPNDYILLQLEPQKVMKEEISQILDQVYSVYMS